MGQESSESQFVDFKGEATFWEGVCFDPDHLKLDGYYADELSAHRAKRIWIRTLEASFFLERNQDFKLEVRDYFSRKQFVLSCEFTSACARYAFWRLTNNQAPEAQYLIETAHIPNCEARHTELLSTPDMRSVSDHSLVLSPQRELCGTGERRLPGWILALIKRLGRAN